MWKKALAGISVLALVTIAFAGAVFAQAENAELRVSEKLDGKIAEYKAANPEWTRRLKSPEGKLWAIGPIVAGMTCAVASAIGFYDGYYLGRQDHAPPVWSGALLPLGEFYFAGYRLGKAARCTKTGDINGDGTVNMNDAVYLVRYLYHAPGYEVLYANADINSDGSVNMNDAVYLVRYLYHSPGYEELYP